MDEKDSVLGGNTFASGFRLKNGKRWAREEKRYQVREDHVDIMAAGLYDTGEPWKHLKPCHVIVLHFRKSILSAGWRIDRDRQEWMLGREFKELCQESLQERDLN